MSSATSRISCSSESQARAPVRSLSGGEKARLLLARIMARESNLLILDEPTNDLDVETLDLLQDILGDYDGTVLLVSHDRDFIDRVATATVALEGGGRATAYPGGWSDYAAQRGRRCRRTRCAVRSTSPSAPPQSRRVASKRRAPRPAHFTERKRLDDLPAVIARIEAEIARLSEVSVGCDLFSRDPAKFRKPPMPSPNVKPRLPAAEAEWLALEERRTA